MSTVALAHEEQAAIDAVPRRLLIGGEWRDGETGATLPVEDPATGEVLCEIADGSPDDAVAAVAAAAAAADAWRAVPARERADVLRRAHDLIAERAERLALVMTLEMGKPLDQARGEIAYANAFMRFYAEEATRVSGRYAATEDGTGRIITTRQPVGLCLFVTPWNFPLAMGARKIAPALAAGCTVVIKPAKQTPLSTLALADVLETAGVPPGVVNVITSSSSSSVVAPMLDDPRLRKLSFTGSTDVGRQLLRAAADQVLRVSMELGGNAPFVVFGDADIDAAIEGAMVAKMRNMGEACTAANRFLVHTSIAGRFTEGLAARMAALVVDRGTVPGSQVGPLIDDRAVKEIDEKVREAAGSGARIACGGAPLARAGSFYAPTVVTEVPHDARLMTEETFGPVAPITTFESEDEAVALANATEYGLAAYLYTRDVGRALRVGERIDSGMVGINQGMVSNAAAPFGGIKQSGLGREGGPEGLEEYLETKYLALSAS